MKDKQLNQQNKEKLFDDGYYDRLNNKDPKIFDFVTIKDDENKITAYKKKQTNIKAQLIYNTGYQAADYFYNNIKQKHQKIL